ncbi:siphovirus Gp157 family protein [Ensifer sp. LBL]|uniref:siphovirus Gp157 family protein n=1 Tax=Ensifer sp. LBL TaxID=2991056 RepID=UPI003D1CEB0E
MTAPAIEHSVRRQTEAAKALLVDLRKRGADDDAELVADTIEGETNLIEALAKAVTELDECDVLVTGLKTKEAEFEARRKAIENRAERIRALIEQAMLATDQVSLKLPTATLSLSKRAPGLIVTDEADIPAKYWVEQPRPAPKLDKKSLTDALREKNAAAIPGATLDNGSFSLTVRRK